MCTKFINRTGLISSERPITSIYLLQKCLWSHSNNNYLLYIQELDNIDQNNSLITKVLCARTVWNNILYSFIYFRFATRLLNVRLTWHRTWRPMVVMMTRRMSLVTTATVHLVQREASSITRPLNTRSSQSKTTLSLRASSSHL